MERLDCDRMFIAVMETGSFTAAAQRLGTSHGQASKLISRLEQHLGVQLFRRSTRALAATDVGRAYYEKIRVLLADYDALNDSVRNSSDAPAGKVRISAPVTFGTTQLTPHLIDFARRYPGIEHGLFKCNQRKLNEYAGLDAYTKRMLDIPGVRETVNIDHIKQGYYSIKALNPNGIVPAGPDLTAYGL